ncbi:biotin--[acetyl-CoA-carboxylase] ligase [Desulfotomaculum sp. 1211_IL3151]|uniref:biotin--[acetyl-CoA-carboxylase] ligase n=1 Tax=Desulfotomaculum sp. 1211_IL3151 TaxID=3084055 RepID=UPI002FDAC16F
MNSKQKILRLLREEEPGYVSGEYICQQLQVSRTAIWKTIESLRSDGYDIEARPRVGYRLLASPELLDPAEWSASIKTQIIGQAISYHKATTSTNDVAKDLARRGAVEGTVVVTEEQTKGRGRLGRTWQSLPQAGLCFSVILYPKANPMEVPQFTMLAAVAVVKALERTVGLKAKVKWPNDVYIKGQKIGGILAEMVAEADRVKYVVLGIGLNVNQRQEELAMIGQGATSLRVQLGKPFIRSQVFVPLLEELDVLYNLWQQQGFLPLKKMWQEVALWVGDTVQVLDLHNHWQGVMEGIDESGALLLRLPNGNSKTFFSGEVSLRTIN